MYNYIFMYVYIHVYRRREELSIIQRCGQETISDDDVVESYR